MVDPLSQLLSIMLGILDLVTLPLLEKFSNLMVGNKMGLGSSKWIF